MNNQKDTFRCKLEFRLAGKTYFIERNGVRDKKGNVKVNVDFWSEEDDVRTVLNAQDRDSTKTTILCKMDRFNKGKHCTPFHKT